MVNNILNSNVNSDLKAFLKPILTWDSIQQSIIDIIASRADDNELTTITQSEISRLAQISPSQVSLHLKDLVKHGHLEVERRSTYHVIHRNVLERGATKAVLRYLLACVTHPACLQFTLAQLCDYTGLSPAEIDLAKGYVYQHSS
ncbi:hypothetical protein [Alicyclobacillus mengziensis]|uniref:Uncharacterized protein n=1 Tax=Alicyclobacillus mengziensis TaxID=2931921 RepID=A0A9X7Z5Q4_9BACL|nr:hypothetical protein [Alicyclobacillus mengziensis]QSO46577.1 hypothetical protein JZ786_19260 [Alicyclobacillus mengziensis]